MLCHYYFFKVRILELVVLFFKGSLRTEIMLPLLGALTLAFGTWGAVDDCEIELSR